MFYKNMFILIKKKYDITIYVSSALVLYFKIHLVIYKFIYIFYDYVMNLNLKPT